MCASRFIVASAWSTCGFEPGVDGRRCAVELSEHRESCEEVVVGAKAFNGADPLGDRDALLERAQALAPANSDEARADVVQGMRANFVESERRGHFDSLTSDAHGVLASVREHVVPRDLAENPSLRGRWRRIV